MIELAIESDGAAIDEISRQVGVFSPDEVACVGELWDVYRTRGHAGGYSFLVYRANGRTLGYACFGFHTLTQGVYDLYWIAVHPDAQGQGVGRALLAQVESRVLERGGYMLLIETSSLPTYAPARRFYETAGYRREALIEHFYAPGDGLVLYSKLLRSVSL